MLRKQYNVFLVLVTDELVLTMIIEGFEGYLRCTFKGIFSIYGHDIMQAKVGRLFWNMQLGFFFLL